MRAAVITLVCACSFEPQPITEPLDDALLADAAPVIDAAPDAMLAACPPAPSGCTLFTCTDSTSCYYACDTPRTWNGARDRCVTDQIGCLATIDDASENSCIFANTNPAFPNLLWFGMRQASGQATPIAGWTWQCGMPSFTAPNWGDPAGEPNDGTDEDGEDGDEDCASMGQNTAWIDIDCGETERYVCELAR